jgi:hypothetical protein
MSPYPIQDGLRRIYPPRIGAAAPMLGFLAVCSGFGIALWVRPDWADSLSERSRLVSRLAPFIAVLGIAFLAYTAARVIQRGVVISAEGVHNPWQFSPGKRHVTWDQLKRVAVRPWPYGAACLDLCLVSGRRSRIPLALVHAPVELQRDVFESWAGHYGDLPPAELELWDRAVTRPVSRRGVAAWAMLVGAFTPALLLRLIDWAADTQSSIEVYLISFWVGGGLGLVAYVVWRRRSRQDKPSP